MDFINHTNCFISLFIHYLQNWHALYDPCFDEGGHCSLCLSQNRTAIRRGRQKMQRNRDINEEDVKEELIKRTV